MLKGFLKQIDRFGLLLGFVVGIPAILASITIGNSNPILAGICFVFGFVCLILPFDLILLKSYSQRQ